MERYKGFQIDYIDADDGRHYFTFEMVYPYGTKNYFDSAEKAKKTIDELGIGKEEVTWDNGYQHIYTFSVVDEIPNSFYQVWGAKEVLPGYLPLITDPWQPPIDEMKIPGEGNYNVDENCLLAIDMRDKPEKLSQLREAACYGVHSFEACLKYSTMTPTNPIDAKRKEIADKVYPLYEEISQKFADRLIPQYIDMGRDYYFNT